MTTPASPQPPIRPPERVSSWSLRLAAWCWGIAGIVSSLVPPATAFLLWWQYRGLQRNTERAGDLLDFVNGSGVLDTTDVITAEQLRDALAAVDGALASTPVWVVVVLIVVYALVAGVLLVLYLVIARCTGRAHEWARITGTVLAVISVLGMFQAWSFFAAVAWVPLDALAANHAGLAIMALHIAGIVLVWLPASNLAVRARRQALRDYAAQFRIAAAQAPQQ